MIPGPLIVGSDYAVTLADDGINRQRLESMGDNPLGGIGIPGRVIRKNGTHQHGAALVCPNKKVSMRATSADRVGPAEHGLGIDLKQSLGIGFQMKFVSGQLLDVVARPLIALCLFGFGCLGGEPGTRGRGCCGHRQE